MYGLIYKITNLINDKVYVGQTTQELKLRLNGRRNLDLKTAEAIKNFLEIDMPLEELFRKNI